jgi:tetratricopeptide (TPR) repeat protein
MNKQMPRMWALRLDTLVRSASAGHTATIPQLIDFATDVEAASVRGEMDGAQSTTLTFNASSLLINLGSDRHHRVGVDAGIDLAREALRRGLDTSMDGHLKYNIANGLTARLEIERAKTRQSAPNEPRGLFDLRHRDWLREARSLFAQVGYSDESPDTRGRALCNLGNLLDHSGRWLEAYQAYVDALDADPTNGNAAGNAAELLRIRAARKRGLPAHYAAVYEGYRLRAIEHRQRTVELAGEAVARRCPLLAVTATYRTTATHWTDINSGSSHIAWL